MGDAAAFSVKSHPLEQEVFAEALLRNAPDQRARFLEVACGTDASLRNRVESLLRAAESPGGILEQPPELLAGPGGNGGSSGDFSELPGDRIDRYKLLQQIGEGGCGVVYMAEQERPVRRRVAVKIIKLGMDTKQVVARFEAERQALALMDHPNIARVFDAGATSNGRPYFVMELVRGVRITDFCDQQNLPTRQRLELFTQVCQAVQHAHQRGIIHRDLKPANILVADHDGVPVPKVIDFGIAKATADQRLTDKTVFTALEQFLGTPAYMSPEQASFSGLDIDTRTDIYSLGVLLYELLTGRTPFDADGLLRSGLDAMRRTIRETEPQPPSARLSTLRAPDLIAAAYRRRVDAPRLINLVRGDLDWIVLKCLEKDRARRYETANALACEMQRHLSHEPVVARPPSFGYRAGKWIRKHKGPAIATVAVAMALCTGTVASTILYWRERTAAEGESLQRAHAELEAAKNMETARFLTELISGIDPDRARGRDVTVLTDLLKRAASRVETELRNQPEVEAEVRNTLGHVYRTLAIYPEARLHLERSLALREKASGPETRATLRTQLELVDLDREEGRPSEAEALCRQVLNRSTRILGSTSELTLDLQQRLALTCLDQRKFQEAEKIQSQVIATTAQAWRSDDLYPLKARGGLGAIYLQQRKYSAAESIHRETLAGLQRILEPEHPGILREMANLAASLHGLGRLGEAEDLYRKTWEIEKRVYGVEHPKSLVTMQNLGTLYSFQGRHAEAREALEEVTEIARRVMGPEHPQTLRAREVLSIALSRAGKLNEAEAIARDLLEIHRRVRGPEDARTLRMMVNIADILARRGSTGTAAEAAYQEVLDLQRRVLGPEHPDSLLTAANLLLVERYLKHFAEAEALCRKTVDTNRTLLGSEHPATLEWMGLLKQVQADRESSLSAIPIR